MTTLVENLHLEVSINHPLFAFDDLTQPGGPHALRKGIPGLSPRGLAAGGRGQLLDDRAVVPERYGARPGDQGRVRGFEQTHGGRQLNW